MKKIGLFLDSEPFDGGKFQYSLSMLRAVCNLTPGKYQIIVAYSPLHWEKHLSGSGVSSFHVPNNKIRWFYDRIWRNLRLPTQTWRRLCASCFNFSQQIINTKCDLWIFTADNTLPYQLPVPALVSIFDLMHRYEKRFPEVSAYGRFTRREKHFNEVCKWSSGILVDSETGKNQVVESYHVSPAKVYTLPFIAPDYITKPHSSEKKLSEKYNLPEKFIFYPAQFWEHKNHKNLIRAVKRLKPSIPDLKLVLVGSKKNAYPSVLELVNNSGLQNDVYFLGYVPDEDISEIYRHARAMIMPTFFGPTNIPPLEAFAVKCPAAVSGIYGMPEQSGDAALFFNPASEIEISEAIKKLWLDDKLCSELSEKGYRNHLSWNQNNFNRKLEDILDQYFTQK
ncbi:MAG: glycosyltransferase family 4 protein [Candidatus Riflebacteria bacterium]|nr:glycosyltransferase family 4 protein [Candidatus Riflebacteria bacterium]